MDWKDYAKLINDEVANHQHWDFGHLLDEENEARLPELMKAIAESGAENVAWFIVALLEELSSKDDEIANLEDEVLSAGGELP